MTMSKDRKQTVPSSYDQRVKQFKDSVHAKKAVKQQQLATYKP